MQYSKEIFEQFDKVYIVGFVLRELERNKHSINEEKKYLSRRACRDIEANKDKVVYFVSENKYDMPDCFDKDIVDNRIISNIRELCAKDNEILALSNDILFRFTCESIGIVCEKFGNLDNTFDNSYLGYKEITLSEYELATFYECKTNNWNILLNEYLLIKDGNGDIVDKLKWTEKGFKSLSYKNTESRYVGKVKPRNLQQELYMDMLQDKESKVKIAQGSYGVGKDFLALAIF